jgi:hypothetical protein
VTSILEHDAGALVACWGRSTATDPGSDFVFGWILEGAGIADDAAIHGVAFKEAAGGGGVTVKQLSALGVG